MKISYSCNENLSVSGGQSHQSHSGHDRPLRLNSILFIQYLQRNAKMWYSYEEKLSVSGGFTPRPLTRPRDPTGYVCVSLVTWIMMLLNFNLFIVLC